MQGSFHLSLPLPVTLTFVVLLFLAACGASADLPTRIALAPTTTSAPLLRQQEANQPTTTFPTFPSPTPEPTVAAPVPPVPSATPCNTPGHIQTGVFNSQIAGAAAYRIYLPPCYGLDGRVYPSLYLLSGNIHTDSIWDELGIDEAAESGILGQVIPPLLIVMPEGGQTANNTSGGPYSYEDVILNDLIPFIEATYCAWPEAAGRAIGGLSRGGYWALEIAFRHPAHFVSVGGHSAALLDIAAGPELNPQYTGLNNNLGSLRVYLDIGANDYVIANIRRLHEGMESAAIPHTWVLNEGRHENAYWAAHVADYLAWYTAPWSWNRAKYPVCAMP